MSEVKNLPQGWILTELESVVQIVRGITFPTTAKEFSYREGLIACLRTANVQAQVEWDDLWFIPEHYVKNEEQFVLSDDILISTANSYELVGKVARISQPKMRSTLGAFISLLRTNNRLNPSYLYYLMSAEDTQRTIREMSSTTTNISNVSGGKLKTLLLPIAPKNEQTRIVEKLEELLTDLDTATNELKTAQKKLTQYRQSLLKAAVEGALTAEWRANNTPSESGSQLLERILKERRVRWEQKQLEKFKEQGKIPPKDWQSKYSEPVKPDTMGLMELPEGWVWITADHLISHIETGKSFKCDERTPNNNEIGVVKVSAVSWGEYNELESKTCMDSYRINEFLLVREGDFLFSRANTIELVGACVIAKNVKLQVMLSDKILRFRLVEENLKQWLLFILRSTLGRKQIELLASGNQESMRNIGQEQIRKIALPLPPQAEINHIISSLEQNFVAINEQSISIKTSLKQSAAQRKNILKAAFSGQLVPQDPNDEPASVLLERIKAERVAQEKTPKKANTRKVKEAST